MANILKKNIPAYQFSDYDVVLTESIGGVLWFFIPDVVAIEPFTDWVSLTEMQSSNLVNNESLGYGVSYYEVWKEESGNFPDDGYKDFVLGDLTGNTLWFTDLDIKEEAE